MGEGDGRGGRGEGRGEKGTKNFFFDQYLYNPFFIEKNFFLFTYLNSGMFILGFVCCVVSVSMFGSQLTSLVCTHIYLMDNSILFFFSLCEDPDQKS